MYSWFFKMVLGIVWTVAVVASLGWNIHLHHQHIEDRAYSQADAALNKDMAYRQLVAGAGGIYVPVDSGIEPNPYLAHITHRDVVTDHDQRLTLVNSSYFTRLVHDLETGKGNLFSAVTGLAPMRAANAPDPWQREALESFHRDDTEARALDTVDGETHLRVMRPRHAEQRCFDCHTARDDIEVGDVLGGLSVSVPLQPLRDEMAGQLATLVGGHGLLWALGLFGIHFGCKRLLQQHHRLEYNALHDPLTDLPNRSALNRDLERTITNPLRSHCAVLWFDIDRFKNINDSLGHQVGDQLLITLAERLNRHLGADQRGYRTGGDQFVVLTGSLRRDTDAALNHARDLAAELQRQLSAPCLVRGYELHATPSVGIALFPEHGSSSGELLRHAESAMYHAKGSERGGIAAFTPELQAHANRRLQLENALRTALARGELRVHYQPQVDRAGNLFGFEALTRWEDPELGPISPLEFIPVAEESGLILALGAHVLEEATGQMQSWLEQGLVPEHATISVNVSTHQFHGAGFVDHVFEVLDRVGLPGERLDLELTESVGADDLGAIVSTMERLRERGVRFSIDDFGTGYSSLAYLKQLPLSNLKIDREFVRELPHDSSDASIVETILGMAETLGLEVIAEGVEEEAHLDFLDQRGCDRYQGYYFSRPLPAERVAQWLHGGA